MNFEFSTQGVYKISILLILLFKKDTNNQAVIISGTHEYHVFIPSEETARTDDKISSLTPIKRHT